MPQQPTAKMTGGPGDVHTLLGILRIAQEMTGAVTQYQGVPFGAHVDTTGRLRRPGPREGLTSLACSLRRLLSGELRGRCLSRLTP
jgi:hypothetical protein